MVLTKEQAKINLATSRARVASKKRQIASSRKDIDFKGVRIQDQFDVGRLGIEPFREEGVRKRRKGFKDLGGFELELLPLEQDVTLRKQELDFFNTGGL